MRSLTKLQRLVDSGGGGGGVSLLKVGQREGFEMNLLPHVWVCRRGYKIRSNERNERWDSIAASCVIISHLKGFCTYL